MSFSLSPVSISRHGLVLALMLSMVGLSSACSVEFEEEFDTKFLVPSPPSGELARPYWKARRFKLGKDPADAENVEFLDARLTVQGPTGSDLSFINSLEVYVCSDIDYTKCNGLRPEADLTLLAVGEGFVPGQTSAPLKIIYDGDIRGFVEDQRVVLTWVVYPTAWDYDWPENGIVIQTEVTLLITADPV